jgi:hypothetical protein
VVSRCWVGRVPVNADEGALEEMSVVVVGRSANAQEKGEGGGGSEKPCRRAAAPSGWHAGHVLRVEKGSRAVKGLQRPCAGCTGREGPAGRTVHTCE